MIQADRVHSTPRRTAPSAFLSTVARIHLSHLFRDPYVAAAFRAVEDDGAPDMAEINHPRILDGGAAEVIGDTGRHVRALVEA